MRLRIAVRTSSRTSVSRGARSSRSRPASFPAARSSRLRVAVYFTAPLIAFLRWRGWPFYPSAAFRLFIVRPFWYAQLLLPLVAAGGLLGLIGGLPFGHALDAGRIAASVVFVIVADVLVAGYAGSRRLVVREVDVVVPGLSDAFDGLRIAQLSDLHVGPHTPRRFLARVLETTHRMAPDLIAVTGDLIDDRAEDVAAYARALGELDAPLGVFIIPGQSRRLRRLGRSRARAARERRRHGARERRRARFARRRDARAASAPAILPADGAERRAPRRTSIGAMARVPNDATVDRARAQSGAVAVAREARRRAHAERSHALGTVRVAAAAIGAWRRRSSSIAMGAHIERDSALYISPGTGYWGIPFRLGASPEVTLVTLRRGDAATAPRASGARGVAMDDDAQPTTPYEQIGGDAGIRQLVDRFYDLMDASPEAATIRRAARGESQGVAREALPVSHRMDRRPAGLRREVRTSATARATSAVSHQLARARRVAVVHGSRAR